MLQVGGITVAIDGTKILANASKHSAVSYAHAGQTMQTLDLEIAALLAKAEQADATPLQDGLTIPAEVQRRQERKAQLARARAEMEARAYARCQAEQAEHAAKLAAREIARAAGKKPRGPEPKAPNDKKELLSNLAALRCHVTPAIVLIDSGFASEAAVTAAERDATGQPTGLTVLAALRREPHGRTVTQLEKHPDPPAPAYNVKRLHRLGATLRAG